MFLVLRWPLTLCCLATQSRLLPCPLSVYSLMEGSWIDGIADEVTASQWRRLCSLYTYKKCISSCHQVHLVLVPRNAFDGLYISTEISRLFIPKYKFQTKTQVSRKGGYQNFKYYYWPTAKRLFICTSLIEFLKCNYFWQMNTMQVPVLWNFWNLNAFFFHCYNTLPLVDLLLSTSWYFVL